MENRETAICRKYILTDTALCTLYRHFYLDMEKDIDASDICFTREDITAYLAGTLKKTLQNSFVYDNKNTLQTALLKNAFNNIDWEIIVCAIVGISAGQ